MRDRGLVVLGLLLFLGLSTSPVWYNLASAQSGRGLELQLPAMEKECVAPIAYMKTAHMKLLNEWRDRAVRDNQRSYEAYNGKIYTISLTGTCLRQCHTSRAGFCDRCHAYSGVRNPYCWDCHLDPRLLKSREPVVHETLTGEEDAR